MSHAAPTHMSKKGKQASSRLLNDLKQEDELRALKSELKNDLESYVFKTRSFIRENEDELSKVSEEEEREGILADLEVLEDWLYEDGEDGGADAEVPVYKKKRKDMDKRVNSIKQRLLELELRPKAVEAARAIIKSIGATIETFPTLRPQILPTMIEELKNETSQLEAWLDEVEKEQAELDDRQEPRFSSSEVSRKMKKVKAVVTRLLQVKRPEPPSRVKPSKASNANETKASSEEDSKKEENKEKAEEEAPSKEEEDDDDDDDDAEDKEEL